jgi:predicted transcriptional regulator
MPTLIIEVTWGGNILKPPCEIIVNRMLPHIRAEIVRILINDYNMKQIDVATRLGITQASVSQYISSARGGDDFLHNMFPEMKEYTKNIAEKIASGENKEGQIALLCQICEHIREKENFCTLHRQILQVDKCGICYNGQVSVDK